MRLSPLARWALVAAIVLMGAALAVTAWSTHAGVANASDALIRGQADLFQHDIRNLFAELGRAPADGDLAELLDDRAPDGLRFIATLTAGDRIVASAGTPAQQGVALAATLAAQESDTPLRIGDRVRVIFRGPPRRHFAMRHRARFARPSAIVIEFEPRQSEALRAAATRTLGIGSLAAGMLLVVALGLVRWFMRRAAIERERERERRLASLGQLSAVLAHEIRNPLASLKGNAQLLAGLLPPGDKPRGKADRVVEEAIRLEDLTNDLLEFARTGELHAVAVDPAALLRDAAEAHAGDVRIETAGAPATWTLDPDRMRQVLGNLIDNAVQAGPPVTASVAAAAGRLLFAVRDSGPGVPAEDQARIFEPFFTKRTRGTGLGLAVVKRVIELHHGTITVADAPGGGAVFRISLPKG
jgi:two-component system sensor histidine kinase HydH